MRKYQVQFWYKRGWRITPILFDTRPEAERETANLWSMWRPDDAPVDMPMPKTRVVATRLGSVRASIGPKPKKS
jgi:hypothetical protein